MRIISGIVKGRSLISPKGSNTRPTQDYIRESLFNIIRSDIDEAQCLDLFAGSGALGIEALSRGAAHCVFCDKNFSAINAIKANIANLGFEDRASIVKADWQLCLKGIDPKLDLVFIDPPYDFMKIAEVLEQLSSLLNSGSLVIVERDKKSPIVKNNEYSLVDKREYGISCIYFYRYKGKEVVNEQ